jgi:hypothetical protein
MIDWRYYILKWHDETAYCVRFEVFTAVTMKNVVFLDVELCRSWVNRRFRGAYRLQSSG